MYSAPYTLIIKGQSVRNIYVSNDCPVLFLLQYIGIKLKIENDILKSNIYLSLVETHTWFSKYMEKETHRK
jgi:hypothetical protein